MADMELIDDQRAVTPTGQEIKNELTLPIHMSMSDIAAQLNPGGADAVRAEGEAEWARLGGGARRSARPRARGARGGDPARRRPHRARRGGGRVAGRRPRHAPGRRTRQPRRSRRRPRPS